MPFSKIHSTLPCEILMARITSESEARITLAFLYVVCNKHFYKHVKIQQISGGFMFNKFPRGQPNHTIAKNSCAPLSSLGLIIS